MKNFEIGKDIKALIDNAQIEGINNKVFPLIANADTTFPFVVYRRSNYQPFDTKDYQNEIVGVEVVVVSNTYSQSVSIADQVADALIGQSTNNIDDIKITNIFEDCVSDSFVQQLNFDVILSEN